MWGVVYYIYVRVVRDAATICMSSRIPVAFCRHEVYNQVGTESKNRVDRREGHTISVD